MRRRGLRNELRADARAREGTERRPLGRPSDLAGGWGGAPRQEDLGEAISAQAVALIERR
jgi:hypothetical protein